MAKAKTEEVKNTEEAKNENQDLRSLIKSLMIEALSEGKSPEEAERSVLEQAEAKKVRDELEAYYNELVPFRAFKDNGKYKDDIIVGVNGKMWRIRRGVDVMIPRKVFDVIRHSEMQNIEAAAYMESEQESYRNQAKERNL